MSMGFGFGLSLSAMQSAATPAGLFANGEQGIWLMPSDMAAQFQDSLGTTPVTAFGQPVGLSLDHSKAMMPGPELISGSWMLTTAGTATATESPAGTLNLTGDGTNAAIADMSIATVIGATYKVTASLSSAVVALNIGPTQGSGTYNATVPAIGPISATFVATTATTWIRFTKTSAALAVITTISARQTTHLGSERITNGTFPTDISGWTTAHTNASTVSIVAGVATWSTNGVDAARLRQSFPTVVGETYLVSVSGTGVGILIGTTAGTSDVVSNVTNNLRPTFTFVATTTTTWFNTLSTINGATLDNISVRQIIRDGSEMNSILPWTLTVAGTATATESPTGTLNLTGDGTNAAAADKVFGTVPGASYRVTFNITGASLPAIVGTSQGGFNIVAPTVFSIGLNSFQFTATSATSWLRFSRTGASPTGVVSNISVKLVAGAHASQATSTKRPLYVSTAGGPGLQFDGVDDFLQTPTIVPGTDTVQIFAGLRKLSDSGQGILAELSTSYGANTNVISVQAPVAASPTYTMASKGTTAGVATGTGYAAPDAAVITGLGQVSTDASTLRRNGTQIATAASDQGTGNYAANPVFLGMRGGSSLPFNGVLNELIMRFGPTPAADQIAAMERYTNSKTVAY